MDTLTLQIDRQSAEGIEFLNYVRSLAQTKDFLIVKSFNSDKAKGEIEEKTTIMDEIEQGLREVKLMREGKLRKKSLKELIDELD